MSTLPEDLNSYGIVSADGLYSPDEIATINGGLDAHFAALAEKSRSYAYSENLLALGLLDRLLSDRLVDALYEVMPDPVFYHLHCYEIVGKQAKAHIFGNELRGWHRDSDSEYCEDGPSHVSLFVHLSDIDDEDGAFEFMPHTATSKFANNVPGCRMTGPAGTSYFWNRHFLHRASPNRGARRRRILKMSIQSSRWPSTSLLLGHIAPVVTTMRSAEPRRAALFGHRDATTPTGPARPTGLRYSPVPTNIEVDIGLAPLLRSKLKVLIKGAPPVENVPYEA